MRAQVEQLRSRSRHAGIAPVVARRRGTPRRHFGHTVVAGRTPKHMQTLGVSTSPARSDYVVADVPGVTFGQFNLSGIAVSAVLIVTIRQEPSGNGPHSMGTMAPQMHNRLACNSARSEIKIARKSRNYSLLRGKSRVGLQPLWIGRCPVRLHVSPKRSEPTRL